METRGLTLLLAALAVYRASKATTEEDGPFRVFHHARALVYRLTGDSWVFEGVTCARCASLWLGLLAAWALALPWWVGLALSGFTVLAQEVSSGRNA